jgi:Phage integrase family
VQIDTASPLARAEAVLATHDPAPAHSTLGEDAGHHQDAVAHVFRRTFASLLKTNGEDIKVVQELCRHANPNTTMSLYAPAFTEDALRAPNKVVVMARNAMIPAKEQQQPDPDLAIVRYRA